MIGNNIKITILQCEDGKVRLGIEAPDKVKIHRQEVFNAIKEENKKAFKILPENIAELGKL